MLSFTTRQEAPRLWTFTIRQDGVMIQGGAGYPSRATAQRAARQAKADIAVDLDPDISDAAR